jgi:hypothetical protein
MRKNKNIEEENQKLESEVPVANSRDRHDSSSSESNSNSTNSTCDKEINSASHELTNPSKCTMEALRNSSNSFIDNDYHSIDDASSKVSSTLSSLSSQSRTCSPELNVWQKVKKSINSIQNFHYKNKFRKQIKYWMKS